MSQGHGPHSSRDHFSHRRSIKELLSLKDTLGYVEGKVFMIWPPRNKLQRVELEVTEDSTLHRFEVEVPHKDEITFRPHERVFLALKGVNVDRRRESNAPHKFPVALRFPDGVVLKYLSGARAGKVVDTWEDEWFDPGMVRTVSDVASVDASEIYRALVSNVPQRSMVPPRGDIASGRVESVQVDRLPLSSFAVPDGAAASQSTPLAEQPDTKKSGSKRTRKKRKLHKEKSTLSCTLADAVVLPDPEQPQSTVDVPSADVSYRPPSCAATGLANETTSNRGDEQKEPLRENNNTTVAVRETSLPILQLKAGIRTQRGDVFTALGDLRKGPSLFNVIGVVTSVFPEKKTRTNEWSRSFTLVDPSTISPQGIRVNCFQKKYLEWLPQVQKDDVVILRKLRTVEFYGVTTATGYGDKLRWAVYDSLKLSVRPPNRGNAPEKEAIDEGMGYEFCPYWEPIQDSVELEYCRQIGEWWKAKCEHEQQNVSAVECSARVPKQHLPISDVSPDLPSDGFFNCTVEVLQKFSNHGAPITVYVTDYTASPLVRPMQAAWCPPGLSNYVLQCSMWDNAANIANIMNPGEYWYLHNVRARWSQDHYMECRMREAEKVTQLYEAKFETQPYLGALLARKREFKSNASSGLVALHVFPEMRIQDVDGSTSFLTCVVELLDVDLNSQDGHFIYATDYTYNPDLPATISTADWARNLEHRVVKIKLDDTQAQTASDLKRGSIYTIKNLRIKRSNASGSMHGCLGGEHTLIESLRDLSSCHAHMLQRDKDKWKRESMLDVLAGFPNAARDEARGLPRRSSTTSITTLQEVLVGPAPNTFRVLARAMDFFPFSLEDACVLRCTKCDSSPPPSFKQCPRCDDMMETHSKWFYCLYILLQDDNGGEVIVSLSGKKCTLLQGVDPTDFRCDREAFLRFLAKLHPVLGNLRDVHVAWSRNEHKVIESPPIIFTLESWIIGNEKAYNLLSCEFA